MDRVGRLNAGWVNAGGQRITHGLEVYREQPGGAHDTVSFVNVAGRRTEMRLAV